MRASDYIGGRTDMLRRCLQADARLRAWACYASGDPNLDRRADDPSNNSVDADDDWRLFVSSEPAKVAALVGSDYWRRRRWAAWDLKQALRAYRQRRRAWE